MLEVMYDRISPRDEFSVNPDTGRLLHALAVNVARSRPGRAAAIEIGRYRGVSTAWLYLAGFDTLVSYDPRPPKGADDALLKLIYDHTGERPQRRLSLMLEAFPPRVDPHIEGGYHFAYIDGNHTGDAPAIDLKHVRTMLAPGAMIVMHDVGPACPDVLRAFNEADIERKVILPTTPNCFDRNSCGLGVLVV